MNKNVVIFVKVSNKVTKNSTQRYVIYRYKLYCTSKIIPLYVKLNYMSKKKIRPVRDGFL
jgi:hypothetical protein